MPAEFKLTPGDKFSMVVIKHCRSEIVDELLLPDGTWVLNKLPYPLSDTWRRSLGELRSLSISDANLVIVCVAQSSTVGVLNEEHDKLREQATDLLTFLRMACPLDYSGAEALQGSVYEGEVTIRQFTDLKEFFTTRGSECIAVSKEKLEAAAKHRLARAAMRSTGRYRRFTLGLRIICDGLQQYFGEERLHQFVRALEGLILPDKGQTTKQFASRCQTFTDGLSGTDKILKEVFDMRSDIEHVHEWDRSLSYYPDHGRESLALRRTRQMESLACFAYLRILSSPNLQSYFQSDSDIKGFWSLQEADRRRLWGPGLDIQSVL